MRFETAISFRIWLITPYGLRMRERIDQTELENFLKKSQKLREEKSQSLARAASYSEEKLNKLEKLRIT